MHKGRREHRPGDDRWWRLKNRCRKTKERPAVKPLRLSASQFGCGSAGCLIPACGLSAELVTERLISQPDKKWLAAQRLAFPCRRPVNGVPLSAFRALQTIFKDGNTLHQISDERPLKL